MDAFDQLAWIAANDVLNVEKITPGKQDRAMLAAARQVWCMLSHNSQPPSQAHPNAAEPDVGSGKRSEAPDESQ